MSLKNLAQAVQFATPNEIASPSRSTGLFFVVDKDFLPGLRTFAYSMMSTGSFLGTPVHIITTQADVANDPFVKALADSVRIPTQRELEPFRAIPTEQVKEHVRHDDVPKYSFLKWLCFEDYGYEQNIYLDVDLLCLQNINTLATELGDADLAVAGRWPQTLFEDNRERRSQAETDANILSFGQGRGEEWPWQPNSGVLVLGKRMMQPEVVEGLFRVRDRSRMGFDQGPLGEWLKQNPDITVRRLAESLNVNQGHIPLLSALKQIEALSHVKILHYISVKPWEQKNNWRLPHRLWHVVNNEASEVYRNAGLT